MVRIYLSKNKKYPGGRLNKTKKKPKPKNQFDIIGTFLTEKSMTGENLTKQIFSYLDISSIFEFKWYRKLGGKIWIMVILFVEFQFHPSITD